MKLPRQYDYLITTLIRTLGELGVDPDPILNAGGVNPANVDKTPKLITKQQYASICFELIQRVDVPGLGLILGRNTSLNDRGAAGYIVMTSRTLREAAEINAKYRVLVTSVVESESKITDRELYWRYKSDSPLEKLHRLYIEWAMAAHCAMIRRLTGQETNPSRLLLDYPEPDYAGLYRELFHCDIEFDQPHSEIHYPVEILDRPLPNYDPTVERAMEELCNRLLAKIDEQRDVIHDVKQYLRGKEGFFPSLQFIADKMHVSSRTLHRKLKSRNTTFQALLDETRQELAQQYLIETELQVQQIAERCGFSEAQNFSLAFKRWSGISPSEYRSQHQKGASTNG